MALANCRQCGKLYNKVTDREICEDCYKEEEDLLSEVQDYLRDHRKASVLNIAEDLDIDHDLIEKWVHEDRIHLVTSESSKNKCSNCGRELKESDTGPMCKTCLLKKAMKQPAPQTTQQTEPTQNVARGMYYKKR